MRPLKDLPTKSTQINGEYILPHPRIKDHFFCANVNILDGWECVGVGVRKRPTHSKSRLDKIARALTYEELAMVKNIFWGDEEVVTMFIPPFEVHLFGQQWVSYLWRVIHLPQPIPAPILKLLEHYKDAAKEFDNQQQE